MRCEVLRFKKAGERWIAIVRTETTPPVMGEVPVAKGVRLQVGDKVTLKVFFYTEGQRVKARCFVNGGVS